MSPPRGQEGWPEPATEPRAADGGGFCDTYGRRITYLRVSVTDRCNLRCRYCMPREGVQWFPHSQVLSYEEIARVARVAAGLGVQHIRLTGGEPLVRKDLEHLVRLLAPISGLRDLALTTNGLLLGQQAQQLQHAGLCRVNVSLDTLDAERYARITRGGKLEAALEGLEAALAAGLHPVKVNAVLVPEAGDEPGVLSAATRGDIERFARLATDRPVHVRFIELMAVGVASQRCVRAADIVAHLETLGELRATGGPPGAGPARYFRLTPKPDTPGQHADSGGTLGVIPGASEVYCEGCNRLRLGATGKLRACLFADDGVDLKPLLRAGGSEEELAAALRQAALAKPLSRLHAQHATREASMCQIGG